MTDTCMTALVGTLALQMVSGIGQYATDRDGSNPDALTTIDFYDVRDMVDAPQQVEKPQAQWLIPSTHKSRKGHDQHGLRPVIWADLDAPTTTIQETAEIVRGIVGGSDFEVYASRSATPERQKCRILIPLAQALSPDQWLLASEVFDALLTAEGLATDRAATRLGQVLYLPNQGEFYDASSARDGDLFEPLEWWVDEIAERTAELERQRVEQQLQQEAARKRRETLQSSRSTSGFKSVIDAFNATFDVAEVLARNGYSQRGDSFMHPASATGSYSATVRTAADGVRRVHSLSTSDPLHTDGAGAHDAFSAFCVLEHHGDQKAAMKDAGDNLLTIGGESWNKVQRREWAKQQQEQQRNVEPAFAPLIDQETGEIMSDTAVADAPFASELDLAERFARECNGQFRWSPGMDWMWNADTHWERDEHLRRFNVAKAVCRSAASEVEKPPLRAKLCSAATTSAVLNLARSEQGIVTPVAEWDAHPMLLNTPSGVYDLETGRTVSRDGLLFTQITGTAPNKMATPVWDKFLQDVFASDLEQVEFIQRLAGYCLTGSIKEQKLFFLHGEGSNGKSVLLDVLQEISGRYAHNLPAEALMTAKHERHPTTFAALQGKRLAVSSEIGSTEHWAEARIKSLTGDAKMTARYMRQDEFSFSITHKHVLAGNFKPRFKGDDFAMARRMVLVPFTRTFEGLRCDPQLRAKLQTEYAGILQWAIEGAVKWSRDGLMIPDAVTASSKAYMAEQNDLALWIEECCVINSLLRTTSTALYQSFAGWKQRNGEHAGSNKDFSQRLERQFTKTKGRDGRVFAGLGLKPGHEAQAVSEYERSTRGA